MLRMMLTGGAPDEPDTSDWNALCNTPGPQQIFAALFHDVANFSLPALTNTQVSEDETRRVHTMWCGSQKLGVKVIEIESPETTAFPMFCTWETFGLPGMKIIWNYSLEHAGQLGYVAFRHGKLMCEFQSDANRQRFTDIWQKILGRTPVFELV